MKKKHLFALLLSGMFLLPASSVARAEDEIVWYHYGFFLSCDVVYRSYPREMSDTELLKIHKELEAEYCHGIVGGEGEIH